MSDDTQDLWRALNVLGKSVARDQELAIAALRDELLGELRELDARLTGVHEHALRSLTATLSGKDSGNGKA